MHETKVLLSVLGALIALTLCLRLVENFVSQDIRHIKQIPRIVSDLQQGPPPRVLFLSNSLTHESIVPEVLTETWATAELPSASIGKIYPDDTFIVDWIYVFRAYVLAAAPKINLLVVSFGDDQLTDNRAPSVERLGGFGGLTAASYAFAEDVTSLSGRVRYLLGATSRVWLNRERVQTRLLAVLPGYKAFAASANRFTRDASRGVQPPRTTYTRLARFLCVVPNNIQVVFVANPLPAHYPLPDDLHRTIAAFGAKLIDMQGFGPLSETDFPDGYHLSPAAAVRYSKALAVELEPFVNDAVVRRSGCSPPR